MACKHTDLMIQEPPLKGEMTDQALVFTRLGLQNFRNYPQLDLSLEPRHICFYGLNGAGKTNLLEAISLLGPGRGIRGAVLSDLCCTHNEIQSENWAISVQFLADDIAQTLQLNYTQNPQNGPKRQIKLDGAALSANDLADILRIIWITPDMDRVFASGAGARRKFWDRQVLAHFPDHGRQSVWYEKAMRERILVLTSHNDPAWLDALETRMAESGAIIMLNRMMTLTRLQHAIAKADDTAFPKADISLTGSETMVASANANLQDIRGHLMDSLKTHRALDRQAGRNLIGPHRTDLQVIHTPSGQIAKDCSTGQQKALLIGLILANARAIMHSAYAPILLLDEAAAHLDIARRQALCDELDALGTQTWLTGTDYALFEGFGKRAQYIELGEGKIMQQG